VKALLCTVHIFAGLDDKALEIFLERARRASIRQGVVIGLEGELNHCMFLVETGKVSVVKNFNKPETLILAELGPGDFCGEMCILEAQPRAATIQAATKATVISVPSSAFYHLYEQMPKQHSILILNIARDLSRRLRRLDEAFACRH
jgi:CRP/FNR family transcriptional regulator, cyclic AMP receptor protein